MINKQIINELKRINERMIDNALSQSVIFDYHNKIDLTKMPIVYKYANCIYRDCLMQKKIFQILEKGL